MRRRMEDLVHIGAERAAGALCELLGGSLPAASAPRGATATASSNSSSSAAGSTAAAAAGGTGIGRIGMALDNDDGAGGDRSIRN